MWTENIFAQTASALLCSILFSCWWPVGRRVFASVVHNKVMEEACRFQLGAVIKEEGMVLPNKTRPATGCYKISLLQQGHQYALFSDVMGHWCKTS